MRSPPQDDTPRPPEWVVRARSPRFAGATFTGPRSCRARVWMVGARVGACPHSGSRTWASSASRRPHHARPALPGACTGTGRTARGVSCSYPTRSAVRRAWAHALISDLARPKCGGAQGGSRRRDTNRYLVVCRRGRDDPSLGIRAFRHSFRRALLAEWRGPSFYPKQAPKAVDEARHVEPHRPQKTSPTPPMRPAITQATRLDRTYHLPACAETLARKTADEAPLRGASPIGLWNTSLTLPI
jgi:hypothetical protein